MNKTAKIMLLAVLILAVFITPAYAEQDSSTGELTESEINAELDRLLGELNLSELEQYYNSEMLSGAGLEEALSNLSKDGLSELTIDQVLQAVWDSVLSSLSGSAGAIIQIAILMLLMGIMKHMTLGGSVSQAAGWAGYIVIATMAASLLTHCVTTATSAIESISGLTEALCPVLMTLLISMGGVSTQAVLSPVMAALTSGVFVTIKTALIPAVVVMAVISLASSFSQTVKLEKLSGLIGSVVKWALGLIFLVFLGVISLKGLAGSAIDGLSFRTVRYTVGKLIPVIGGQFSDTLGTLSACGVIVKNSVGIVGMLSLAGILLSPVISLAVTSILLRLAAAVSQPFADERCVSLLEAIGGVVTLLMVLVLTCAAMAFISAALLTGAMPK